VFLCSISVLSTCMIDRNRKERTKILFFRFVCLQLEASRMDACRSVEKDCWKRWSLF